MADIDYKDFLWEHGYKTVEVDWGCGNASRLIERAKIEPNKIFIGLNLKKVVPRGEVPKNVFSRWLIGEFLKTKLR